MQGGRLFGNLLDIPYVHPFLNDLRIAFIGEVTNTDGMKLDTVVHEHLERTTARCIALQTTGFEA